MILFVNAILFESLTEFNYLDYLDLGLLGGLRFDVLCPAIDHLDQPLLLLPLQHSTGPARTDGLGLRIAGRSETIFWLQRSQCQKHGRITCRTVNNMSKAADK